MWNQARAAALTEKQSVKLQWIAATNPRLHRAYLLKEGLRLLFQMPYNAAVVALDKWLVWARRCQIRAFIDLAAKITRHRERILAAIEHNLSNALIALAMLTLGPNQPTLPDRN